MRRSTQLILASFAAVFLATGIITVVNADPGGRTWGYGYFTNRGRQSSGFNRVIGAGIPSSTNKNTFINYIDNKRQHGDPSDKTGAQFIIQLMRGVPRDHNRPSAADVQDWKDLINDPSVSLHLENYTYHWNSGYMDGTANDDAYYPESAPFPTEPSLVFRQGGDIVFVLKLICGNPVGNFDGIHRHHEDDPDPTPPFIDAAGCSPMAVTVHPGADVYGNPIPIRVTTPLGDTFGPYSVNHTINLPNSYVTGNVYTIHFQETHSYVSGFTPWPGHHPIVTGPHSWNNNIGPCYNYSLTPNVSLGGQTLIELGGEATVTSTVDNVGLSKTKNTTWRLTRLTYSPGVVLSAADRAARVGTSDSPCTSFPTANRPSCNTVQDGVRVFLLGTTSPAPAFTYSASASLPIGSQVCFSVSVNRPTQNDSPVWRHSEMLCMIVGKKPKVQIHGGDIRVGGKIETSVSTTVAGPASRSFGSWVEYGAFAVNGISGFSSGSALNGGSTGSPTAWSRLTFANIDNGGSASQGHYLHAITIPSIADQFLSQPSAGAPTADVGTMVTGRYDTANFTLTGGNIGQMPSGKGKTIVIVSSGTVTISGDIFYKGPGGGDTFTSIGQLPQLIIIAKNIDIDSTVAHIDAWLISTDPSGVINTCSDVTLADNLTSNVCANSLLVNGPVSASHIYLRRTAGADDAASPDEPAEVFNLPANTYLWAQQWSSKDGKAQTVYTKELPPRF